MLKFIFKNPSWTPQSLLEVLMWIACGGMIISIIWSYFGMLT